MSNFKSSCASRIFGKFASTKFPSFIQFTINKTYVKLMKVDMNDFLDVKSYKSLNELFTRRLEIKRKIDNNEDEFISPCDAYISECGDIKEQKALQIKGHSYKVRELLSNFISKATKDRLIAGKYINFYLSPKDYHRYHVPIDMQIKKAIHIPGKLFPVNLKWLKKVPELFIENERVVLECYTKDNNLFFMVFVGALNVGKMKFVFDDTINTNAKSGNEKLYMYDDLWMKKGEELGNFEMGSTIVMLFEKDSVELTCKSNNTIRFTDLIGKIKGE